MRKNESFLVIAGLLAVVLFMAVPMRVNAVPPGYTLEKADEFDNTALDTSLWIPYYLECRTTKERAAARYSFKDGCLVLRIDKDQPTYYSGSDPLKVSSVQTGQRDYLHKDGLDHTIPTIMNYTPQYGYFEIRAKLVNQTGYHCAFWAVGSPGQEAEIDIMEQYGNAAASNFNLIPWNDKSLSQSNGTQTLPFNPSTGFHLYALEWDSKSLKFYVDDVLIRTINQAVKYPVVFLLSVYENSGWTGSADLSASEYPREFYVDYFRAYTKGGTADAGAGGSGGRGGSDAGAGGSTTGGAGGGAGTGGSTSGGRGGATGTSTTSAGGSSGTGGTLSGGSGGAAGASASSRGGGGSSGQGGAYSGSGGAAGSTAGGTGGALGTGGATGTGGVTGGSGGTTAAGGSVGSGGAGASGSSGAGQGGHSMTGTSTAPAGRSSGCSCDIARTSHVGLGRLALLVGLLGLAVFRRSRQRGS
jgi:hypothetical protein